MKKAISLLLVGAMVTAMVAGCENHHPMIMEQQQEATAQRHRVKQLSKIRGQRWIYHRSKHLGTGAYPLDIIVHADEKAATVAGQK